MSFNTTGNRISYIGDDITTAFSFPYLFYDNSHLKVILVSALGVETVQTITTHYTVTGVGNHTGGTVTMLTPPATGEELIILRVVPYNQGLLLVENDPFPSQSVMEQLDLNVMMAQQLAGDVERALVLPRGATASTALPTPSPLKSFRWNATATALEETTDPAVAASAAAQSESNAATSESNAHDSEVAAAAAAVTATNAAISASANVKTIGWAFSDSTSMADPGASTCRFNNADLTAVTAIAVSKDDINAVDVSDYVGAWGASTNAVKGTVIVRKVGDDAFLAVYSVTAPVVDSSGWLEITVAFVTGTGSLDDGDAVYLHFTRAGDAGATGTGSGDLVAANNLSDLDDIPTARSNLGLGSLATSSSVSEAQINSSAVTAAKIPNNELPSSKLTNSGVTAGTYGNLVINEKGVITAATPPAVREEKSLSGTAVDFTSAPVWARRVTLLFSGVKRSAPTELYIQIGDSGGVKTTGYAGARFRGSGTDANAVTAAVTNGFQIISILDNASNEHAGMITLSLIAGTTWVASGSLGSGAASGVITTTAGVVTLGSALTTVRITANGTATLAGEVTAVYE